MVRDGSDDNARDVGAVMNHTYDPTKINIHGLDRMRFELGDTLVEGGADTCALSDEEYSAILDGIRPGRREWVSAKLYALEAILFKLSYMVDTKVDVLTYGFGDRADRWRKLHDALKEELQAGTGVPSMDRRAMRKPPYFYTGIHDNPHMHNQ
ncbi:MAG: hypothetical protein FWE80_01890 [Oscillospiraceae bacterium]|nr:hypothetical protein [Oscillospiraceae bacterium]